MIRTKKGFSFNLPEIILAVVVILVLILIVPKLVTLFTASSSVQKCHATVELKYVSKNIFPDLDCKTQYLEFKESGIYKNGEFVREYSEAPKEDIREEIAEEMRACWYQFHEGTIKLFDGNVFSAKNNCVVCSEVRFGEGMEKVIDDTKIENFNQWLADNKMKGMKGADAISYKDYLMQKRTADTGAFLFSWDTVDYDTLNIEGDIDINSDYYIIYAENIPSVWDQKGVGIPKTPIKFSVPFLDKVDTRFFIFLQKGDYLNTEFKCDAIY